MVRAVRAKHPKTPVFVLGESMGGAAAVLAAPEVEGVILAAPALWPINPFMYAPLWLGAHLMPGQKMTGEDLKIQASDNLEALRALGRDRLVIKASRMDAVYGLVNLMDGAHARAGALATPVLLLYGEKDQIVPPGPVREFAEALEAPHVFTEYPEGWHLLLRDLQREKVWKDVADWVLNKGIGD
jgi:alpha-beta hydrolase superfamily lysophospholipase